VWFLKHRKKGTKGFSLVEIIVVMTIVSVLVAIAVPTALQQRKKSSDASMKADALQIATGMQNALQSWNGVPPTDIPLTFATPTWSITYGANTIVSGSVSAGDVVSGTIWADGSYCAQVVNSSGSNNWIIRSDTGQLTSGTCPSTALGGLGSLPTSTTVTLPGAPGNLTVVNTLGVDNSLDIAWSAVAGATSYLVNVTGVTPITVTAPAVNTTVTNIAGGDTTVSVRAVNASGSGQASATNITVLGGTLFNTGITTPLTAGSGSATLERVQIGTAGLGLGGTSLTSDASTIKFGTNAATATAAWIAGRTDGGVNFYTQSAGGSIINNLSLTPTVNTFNNNLSVSASTTSTSSTTGALTVTGGTGVGGNLYVGGNLVLTGTCTGCSGGAATITDDTTTNATYYPALSLTTTGTLSAVKTSSTKLSFNPLSGILTASAISSGSGSQLGTTYNILKTNNPSFPALITQGTVSQAADIVQFQDSGANILARVDAYGNGAFANHNASRVKVATTVALASSTYANGTSGIGATLTESTNGILAAIDAYTPVVGDRILVKNQATTFQNGIYSVTSIGAAGAPWVLTRSTDSDTAAKIAIGFIGVDQGATNTGTFWNTNFTSANTVGTTALAYAAFTSGSGAAITVTDDTSTNATYYPSLSLATSGTLSAVKTSSTKLSFNPSTGLLTTAGLTVLGTSTLNGTLNINTSGTGIVIRGLPSQTADLQQWQNSAGVVLAFMGAAGQFKSTGQIYADNTNSGSPALVVRTNYPNVLPMQIQGAASQTANLQEWQNSAGTVLASVAADGTLATNFLTALGGAGTYPYLALSSNSIVLNTRNAAYIGLVVQGTASQTADLLQIKNSSGTVVSRIASDGGIEAANGIFAGYGSYAAFSAVTTAGFLVGSPGNPGLIVRGATAQTADLLQLQNSSGSSLVKVDAYGQLYSVQQQITQTNAGAIPLQITGAPLQTADLLQIKNNAGTLLANVDALGNASFANQYSSRVKAASTASLTVTYSNGTAGVGATLTNAGAQAVFAIDGYAAVVGDRILIKDQATGFQNGIYTITNIGSGASNWVLTRATDSDTASKLAAGLTAVDKGITNTGTYWKTSFSSTNVIGTDGMTWTPFTSGTGAAATITDDNSTNANYYLTLSTTNTGSLSAIKTASTKLTFNPSSGILTTAALTVNGAATFNGSLTVNGNTDKVRVRIATTSAGTLATSFANGQTVDGVILATGDRILIKNQATSSENGIYTVNASGAPTRATDADAASKISTAFVAIDQGTTLSGTYWYTTFKSTDTVGTTGMNWVAFGTGGGAYTAPTLGSTLIPSGATVSTIAGLTLTAPAINTGADSNIGVIVKGNSVTQTADLQQWKNSAGTVLANVTAGGVFGSNYYTEPTATSSYLNLVASDAVYLYTRSATNKGLVVKGSASQSADLQQWQDNLGNIPTRIDNTGQIHTASGTVSFFGTNTNLSATLSVQPVLSSAYGLAIRGLAGQTGDLQQWQNSAGTVEGYFRADGTFYTNDRITSINGISAYNASSFGNVGSLTPYLYNNMVGIQPVNAADVGLVIKGAASQTGDLQQWRNNAGTVLVAVGANGVIATGTTAGAPTIVSATTIAPVTPILFVSGTTTIQTITAPAPISTNGGSIIIVPTGTFSTNTAGNIAIAVTAIVNQAITLTYDPIALKWYPASSGSGGSYTAPTIGSTLISSGATVSTIAGLTLTAPTINGATVSGTFSGAVTFANTVTTSVDAVINGLNVGKGGGVISSNSAIGQSALLFNTTGSNNSAVGIGSLQGNTIGTYNSALGAYALYSNTTGNSDSALGLSALNSNTTGSNNSAVGVNSLQYNTTGNNNSAVGFGALQANTTGFNNIALGSIAGSTLTTGSNDIIIGQSAQPSSATVSNEITLGNSTATSFRIPGLGLTATGSIATTTLSLSPSGTGILGLGDGSISKVAGTGFIFNSGINTSQDSTISGVNVGKGGGAVVTNTILGVNALSANTTGFQNSAIGYNALNSNTTGNYNSAVGQGALQANSTGTQNTAVGVQSLQGNTTGNYNSAVGVNSLLTNTTGSQNSAMGAGALQSNTTGGANSAVGQSALYYNTTGSNNSAVGQGTLQSNTIGSNNSAFGETALQLNSTGAGDSAFGTNALQANTTGTNNTALGINSLGANNVGIQNTSVGAGTLSLNTNGSNNTAMGSNSLNANTSGTFNTATGINSLISNNIGTNNSAFGMNALLVNTSGVGNTAIGSTAGSTLTTGSNDTLVGNAAQPSAATVSNEITLGNASIAGFRIPGLGLSETGGAGTGTLTVTGSLVITGSCAGCGGFTAPTIGSTLIPSGATVPTIAGLTLTTPTVNGATVSGTFSGAVIFANTVTASVDASISGLTVGKGGGAITSNTALGLGALPGNTTGNNNTALGLQTLQNNNVGAQNTAVGGAALMSNTTGNYNSGFGVGALQTNTIGTQNSGFGVGALQINSTGNYNSAFGVNALQAETTGSQNSVLGNTAASTLTTGSNDLLLGYNAQPSSATVSNEITLGNALITALRIPGLGLTATGSTGTGSLVLNTSPNITDPKLHIAINPQVGTTYTFVLTDDGKLMTSTNGTAQIFSIPTNASVAYPIGTQINVVQLGTAQVTINAVTPATTSIISTASAPASPKTRVQYSSMTLIKIGTDQWYVVGDIV